MQQPFVISDSSFSSMGAKGVSHIIPSTEPSYEDLKRKLISMISMNNFGVPNTGIELCNFNSSETFDDELCLRQFQLGIVSPIVVYAAKGEKTQLYDRPKEFISFYKQALYEREALMMYQRT